MMFRRTMLTLALTLLLAACGASTTMGGAAPAGGVAAGGAPAGPDATVNQALDALAKKDEATLTKMFDDSVGNLKNTLAYQAIQRWDSLQTATNPPVSGALGPISTRQVQPPETQGQTTMVPVIVTHQLGTARWEFSMRQTDQGWRMLEIHGKVVEQHQ